MVDAGPQMRSANCYYNNFHIRPSAVSGKKNELRRKVFRRISKNRKKGTDPFFRFFVVVLEIDVICLLWAQRFSILMLRGLHQRMVPR